jgi:hypothetical protein
MAQINKPEEYFNTVLYTGNGSTNAITGVNFQPDWTWIKNRSITANHHLFDVARGATKYILTNSSNAEATDAQQLQSFDSDGFTVGTNGNVNGSGNNIVAWNWLAANGTASNTDGSINSTVSASTVSGFSIVSYTGTGANATVGHGLSSAPKMIIFKNTNSVRDWGVYHGSLSDPDNYLTLNQTYAQTTGFNFSNNTAPTSSVFSVGTLTNNNGSSEEYIAYCFAEKKGFSKFGSYTGNGSTDGTFVYTGFKPAFVIVKDYSQLAGWEMADNKRTSSGGNVIDKELKPNDSGAETTNNYIDFLSNGFKLRNGFGNWNGSGTPYIYMAFAEEPLVGDNPATAR